MGGSGAQYCWYDAAYGNMNDYANNTSVDFEKGRDNTANVLAKWDLGTKTGGYGAHDKNESYDDIWGQIKTEVENGWFVPSKGEWAVFAGAFQLGSYYLGPTYGLSSQYWSSSQTNNTSCCSVAFDYFREGMTEYQLGCMFNAPVNSENSLRLSTTF